MPPVPTPPARTSRGHTRLRLLTPLFALALLAAALLPTNAHAATTAWVDTGGDCLNMRSAPGLASATIRCLDHGAEITLLDATQALDGFTWQQIQHQGDIGWVANFYITTNPDDVQVIEEPSAPTAAALIEPPAGGITFGTTTETDPAALAAAQTYPVEGIWTFDVRTQQFRQYLPSAPTFVNTLTSIPAGAVVTIKRAGTLLPAGAPPQASLTVAGTPNQLTTPPIDGITQGVSGTTDPKFLVQAQSFTVRSVSYFHVESQQWLIYLPDAPDHAQSLRQGQLRTNSVVTLRRAPDADPPPSEGTP
ncbi:MAG: SH3 domain-containing protein, partial [Dehalococcoidia bacterium]|nr:SH3 domain-containing protein [Dehalococcoidia bacterium]